MSSPRTATTSLLLLLLLVSWASPLAADDPPAQPAGEKEPPLEFTLRLDGKDVEIRTDEPVRVRVGDREVEARLTARPERLLRVPGLSFRYPAGHGFEVERAEGSAQWTLDGNSNVIILSRLAHKADPRDMERGFMEPVIEQFGRQNVKSSASELRLGGRKYPATRLAVTVASEPLTYDVCVFNSGEATFLLVVQDSPKPDGSTSDETRRVVELLDKTLKLDDEKR